MTANFRSRNIVETVLIMATALVACSSAWAQTPASPAAPREVTSTAKTIVPEDYVIGADDVLSVVYWRDKDMSGEVTVRTDGKISIPLLNDIQAAGLTPEQLRERLVSESKKYIEDPNVTIVVKQINSRKVFITGEVVKPGPYPLNGPMTVVQLLALAGGLKDFADSNNIAILRTEDGHPVRLQFSYKYVTEGKNLRQNITLKPGDTVVVP
jgi:polysaccharide export outer membrane protein